MTEVVERKSRTGLKPSVKWSSLDANLTVRDGEIDLQLPVAGLTEHDLLVAVAPRALTVLGEFAYPYSENLSFCKLQKKILFRRFSMPVRINVEDVAATLENGTLNVTVSAANKGHAVAHRAAAAA